jgi:DNA-binding response OmpR family regulator
MSVCTGQSGRVLIVDDDELTTEMFARILTLEGFEVRTASSAELCLREFESYRPDAIILDLRMPFINGLGLLYRLRQEESNRKQPVVPVAVVTGDQCLDDGMIGELRELGAEIRFKPVWVEDLVDMARSLVEAGTRLH